MALGVEGDGQAIGIVGAGVVQKVMADAQDATFLGQGHLRIVDLAPLLRGGEKVLPAILDPLDGPAHLERGPGEDDLFGVIEHDLGPKAAADKGRDHPHLGRRQAEQRRQAVADGDGCLGCVPQGEMLASGVPVGHDAPVLHGACRAAVDGDAALDDKIGLLTGGLIVALPLGEVGG